MEKLILKSVISLSIMTIAGLACGMNDQHNQVSKLSQSDKQSDVQQKKQHKYLSSKYIEISQNVDTGKQNFICKRCEKHPNFTASSSFGNMQRLRDHFKSAHPSKYYFVVFALLDRAEKNVLDD